MRQAAAILVLASFIALFASVDCKSKGEIVELTDANFEGLTQASTGATTGDWFVMFFASWCGHCKALKPRWQDLAEALHQQVNIAQVDSVNNKALAKRFEVSAYPTLIFFSKGKMYNYEGGRSVDELKSFATGGYASTSGLSIPSPPSFVDNVKEKMRFAKSDLQLILGQAKVVGAMLMALSFVMGWIARAALATSHSAPLPSRGPSSRRGPPKKDQ